MQAEMVLHLPPQSGSLSSGEEWDPHVIRGMLFDLDFTLIHSWWLPIVLKAFAAAHGVEICFYEFLLAKTTCTSLFRWIGDPLRKHGVSVSDEEIERACWAGMKALTHRPELVSEELAVRREHLLALHSMGYGLGIVTNRPRSETKRTLDGLSLNELFNVVISRDDVSVAKPAPDGILRAVEMLGLAPHEVIYFGDVAGDMKAAVAAGVIPIGVINNTFMFDDISAMLKQAGARGVYCLGDFLERAARIH